MATIKLPANLAVKQDGPSTTIMDVEFRQRWTSSSREDIVLDFSTFLGRFNQTDAPIYRYGRPWEAMKTQYLTPFDKGAHPTERMDTSIDSDDMTMALY
jgi:hypothetical protein